MKKTVAPIKPKSPLRKDTKVIVIKSKHSGIHTGQVGVIMSVMSDGYAVRFPYIDRPCLFGGGAISKEGIAFKAWDEVERYKKDPYMPARYTTKPNEEQKQKLLKAMSFEALSLTRGADIVFNSATPYDEIRVESMLDHMWDEGLCINKGKFCQYVYSITDKGLKYVK